MAELKARYYGFIDGGGEPSKPINWIKDEEISPPGGEERNTLAEISELVRRWENDLIGVNQKTNVRWSRAAKLLTELREIIGED